MSSGWERATKIENEKNLYCCENGESATKKWMLGTQPFVRHNGNNDVDDDNGDDDAVVDDDND